MRRFGATSGGRGLGRWFPRACLVAAIVAHGAVVARAAEPSARSLVAEANQAMTAGDNAKALKLMQEAAGLKPDLPEIAYDLGVAHYRAGDYATAADYFMKALAGSELGIEQRARYNLGNCAYSEGLKKQQDPKAAIEKFKAAADRFREALQLDSRDGDARANLERSGLMIRQMKEQQEKQKQQQKQKKDNQQSSQPESQPSSQPEKQPQSQPSSQPENQRQKQGEDKQGQKQQSEQQKAEQKEGEKKEDEKQEGKPQAAEQKKGEQDQEQQAQAAATQRAMSKEEAERLLQLIRDKERQRREAQYNENQKGRSREAPVDKDW